MNIDTGYSPGHPWHYKLGGAIRTPKQILYAVISSGYQGYMADDIKQAGNKSEPDRSAALRVIRKKALKDLKADLSSYRRFTCELREYRKMDKSEQDSQPLCSDIHTTMSLKYNHLYNDFAHLYYIDILLSQQPDLFGF